MPGTKGFMKPGPRYHFIGSGARLARPPARVQRSVVVDRIRDAAVEWLDADTTFTNVGATGPLTFTIPSASNVSYADVRGTTYSFVVVEPYPVTVV